MITNFHPLNILISIIVVMAFISLVVIIIRRFIQLNKKEKGKRRIKINAKNKNHH